jgi:hypothetical protein
MARIHLIVLVHETWRDRYSQVVEDCRQAGLTVEREMIAVGVIAGSIEEHLLAALAEIEGVAAVEPERISRALENPRSEPCAEPLNRTPGPVSGSPVR